MKDSYRVGLFLLVAIVGCGSSETKTSAPAGEGTSDAGPSGTADGSDSSTSDVLSSDCVRVTTLLCARAAACGSDAKLVIAAGGATAEHASVSECKNYYAFLQCPSAQVDWAAC